MKWPAQAKKTGCMCMDMDTARSTEKWASDYTHSGIKRPSHTRDKEYVPWASHRGPPGACCVPSHGPWVPCPNPGGGRRGRQQRKVWRGRNDDAWLSMLRATMEDARLEEELPVCGVCVCGKGECLLFVMQQPERQEHSCCNDDHGLQREGLKWRYMRASSVCRASNAWMPTSNITERSAKWEMTGSSPMKRVVSQSTTSCLGSNDEPIKTRLVGGQKKRTAGQPIKIKSQRLGEGEALPLA